MNIPEEGPRLSPLKAVVYSLLPTLVLLGALEGGARLLEWVRPPLPADLLHQWMVRVFRLFQNAPIEMEPGQFPVDEPVGDVGKRRLAAVGLGAARVAFHFHC